MAAVDADGDLAARIEAAPRSFVLRVTPDELAACARLVATPAAARRGPGGRRARPGRPGSPDTWTVLVGARDRQGLLAMVSGVLAAGAYDVRRAVVATWLDGAAVEAFEVRGATAPWPRPGRRVARRSRPPLEADPLPSARIHFDDASSPWHTICEVEALDQHGPAPPVGHGLHRGQVAVVAASIAEDGDDAVDTFELVQRDGDKLTTSTATPFGSTSRRGPA